jgi:hypothetical protein
MSLRTEKDQNAVGGGFDIDEFEEVNEEGKSTANGEYLSIGTSVGHKNLRIPNISRYKCPNLYDKLHNLDDITFRIKYFYVCLWICRLGDPKELCRFSCLVSNGKEKYLSDSWSGSVILEIADALELLLKIEPPAAPYNAKNESVECYKSLRHIILQRSNKDEVCIEKLFDTAVSAVYRSLYFITWSKKGVYSKESIMWHPILGKFDGFNKWYDGDFVKNLEVFINDIREK